MPPAKLGDYKGIEVGAPRAERRRRGGAGRARAPARVARLARDRRARGRRGRLRGHGLRRLASTASRSRAARAAATCVELGSGRLVPGFEEQLEGAARRRRAHGRASRSPTTTRAEQLAGKDASFAVEVKEVKEKRLPELDDDFAVEAGGFDSLDELRARDRAAHRARPRSAPSRREFREAAVDAVVAQAPRSRSRTSSSTRRRTRCGTAPRTGSPRRASTREQYLQMTGKTEEELVVEAEPDAEHGAASARRCSRRSSRPRASRSPTRSSSEALRAAAPPDASDKQLKRALKRARSQGADEALREDIAMRKAVDLVVESAKPIPRRRERARSSGRPRREDRGQPGRSGRRVLIARVCRVL